jgi:hydroxyethylthiazole kinase-like uncharacterized protein yjeF
MSVLRVRPASSSQPLLGIDRTRTIERQAAAGLPPFALMQRAGAAVARLALAVAPHAARIWIAVGRGNNGGDGIEAAIHLSAAGKSVQVTLSGDPARLPVDAHEALRRALAAGVVIGTAIPELGSGDLAIDALLGIGASGAPEGVLADMIGRLDALPCPVLAVDLPSGLHAGTGASLGGRIVHARHTLALLTVKPGLFTALGRDHAGTVWFDALGVDMPAQPPDAWLAGADLLMPTARAHAQHKGSFGDVAVVGGAAGMAGAAVLAARAASAAGAGRVYVAMLDPKATMLDPLRPEVMFRPTWWQGIDATLAATTVVCGCGGAAAVRAPLHRLLGAAGRLVLDADALNAIASDTMLQTLLRHRASRNQPTILTPHPLEAARLLACDTARIQSDRLSAARTLADRLACVVLLKGSGSIVAAPGQPAWINSTGNAALATAGTGDVLAGWLGGVWAQQHGDETIDAAVRAACGAAFEHGLAADLSGVPLLTASELIERLSADRVSRHHR